MDLLEQIQRSFDSFTNNEKKIAQYIIKDPKHFARSTIESVIEEIGISKAGLIRFSKKMGFNGYIELKYELNRYLLSNNVKTENSSNEDSITNITNRYIEAIEEMANSLDITEIDLAAKSLIESNKIVSCGFNKSGASVSHFSKRVLNLGLSIYSTIDDTVTILDYINILTAKDTLVIFTIEDTTKFFSKHLSTIKESKCNTIVITFDKNHDLAKQADYVFVIPKLARQYATFLDAQALFFIFTEIFVSQLAKLQK